MRRSELSFDRVASDALTLRLADRGLDAVRGDAGFTRGINVMDGKVTHPAVAEAFGLQHIPIGDVLGS